MLYCKICGREVKSFNGLSQHVNNSHKSISHKEYYDKYILSNEYDKICKYCDNDTKFISITKGYTKTCGSVSCKNKERVNTNLKKYGHKSYADSNKFKINYKNKMLNKYGVDNAFKSEDIKHKIKQVSIDKYGTEYPNQSEIVKDKIKKSNNIKYDCDYYLQTEERKNKMYKENKEYFINNVKLNRPDLEFIKFTGEKYYEIHICKWRCKKCNTIFEDYGRATANWLHPRCPVCNPIKYSSIENKIYNYLINIGINKNDIIRCTRQVITPYELDLYIPHLNLGIECDGTYWHSDEVLLEQYGITNKEYCKIKDDLCKDNRVKLLRFTEDEINYEFEKVKETISQLLCPKGHSFLARI